MSYFAGVFLFAIGIAITIALHELGHMGVARMFGMRVRRYFIGFGPTVFQTTKGHTTYGLKAFPLGGFCDIAGMTANDPITEEEKPYAMYNKPWWQRVAVLSGGVAMNVLIGLIVIYTLAVSSGIPNKDADYSARVGELSCVAPSQIDAQNLEPCEGPGPAAESGVQVGDRILAVNDTQLATFVEVRNEIMKHPGETVKLKVDRGGQEMLIDVPVASATRLSSTGEKVTIGAIGVASAPITDAVKTYGPVAAVPATFGFAGDMLNATVQGLAAFPAKIPGVVASIFGAERDEQGPMSVVGASRIGGELAERSQWSMFLMMLASLNFFLALFNVVPLPPLDGGHILVVFWEKIRDFFRKLRGLQPAGPADYAPLMPLTYAVSALLLVVGVLVIVADVVNPIRLFG